MRVTITAIEAYSLFGTPDQDARVPELAAAGA
jgi:hypothetical protein